MALGAEEFFVKSYFCDGKVSRLRFVPIQQGFQDSHSVIKKVEYICGDYLNASKQPYLSSLYTWFAKYYKLRWIYWIPTLGARVRILLKPVVRLGDLHPL